MTRQICNYQMGGTEQQQLWNCFLLFSKSNLIVFICFSSALAVVLAPLSSDVIFVLVKVNSATMMSSCLLIEHEAKENQVIFQPLVVANSMMEFKIGSGFALWGLVKRWEDSNVKAHFRNHRFPNKLLWQLVCWSLELVLVLLCEFLSGGESTQIQKPTLKAL